MSRRVGPRVGPQDVGQRVVLRRRVPGGRFADVLGELLSWDESPGDPAGPNGSNGSGGSGGSHGSGTARVRTRTGEVSVDLRDVVAGKTVPPAPTRRGHQTRAPHRAIGWQGLEDVAADGWRPLELEWLGARGQGWRLRAAEGFTGRANSVLPLGDPGVPLARAVDVAERWYAERGLPARFAVPWPLDAPRLDRGCDNGARDGELDRELRGRGYLLDTPTLVLTASLREVASSSARRVLPAADRLSLDVCGAPDDGWLGVYRYRGQELPEVATRLLVSAPAQAFVSVRDGERTVAVGRGASSRGWTGITAMEVAASHRRRGLARRVVAALVEWGLECGDRSAYLQVAEANTAARRLYESAGFGPHHGYHYRLRP